jgi:hypothetical protein
MSACALCGTPAPPPYCPPAPEGASDLDLRPGDPARYTLSRWIATCQGCGACAPDLAALPPEAAAIAGSAAYRALTSRFQRWAALVAGTSTEAEALLQAAWEAEDQHEHPTPLRLRAAAVWPDSDDVQQRLRLVDVLRRAGAFDAAAARLAPLMDAADEPSRRVAAFQQARIAARDAGRYLLSSALPPAAPVPQVTHGRRAVVGFWSRLLNS